MSRAPRTNHDDASSKEYLASWHATMKLLREGKSFSGRERNCVFLNCHDDGFANVSAVSGLDYDDDGRAIAATDWDHDGDLDLWFANRTGPRLRFMRNNCSPDHSRKDYVVLKLRGTRSNRDGVGARVELDFLPLAPPASPQANGSDKSRFRQIQTLSAGDGYLSQSSKYLHFGFRPDSRISRVTVRWPSGQVDRFGNVEAGKRWLLVEGASSAAALSARGQRPALVASSQDELPEEETSRTAISSRPPMPIVRYGSSANDLGSDLVLGESPLLLILWASWCPTCLEELQGLAREQQQFEQLGLRVVALSVDELSSDEGNSKTVAKIQRMFEGRIEFGLATDVLIDKLRIVQRIVLNRQMPFAVPTSYLVDRDGDLACIYRGAVAIEDLLADLRALDASPTDRRDNAVPFAGVWTTPPRNLLLRPVANVFREHGYVEDYDRFIQMEMDRLASHRRTAESSQEQQSLDRQFAVECFNLARSLQMQGQIDEAIAYYRQGLDALDEAAEAHFHLAKALMTKNEAEQAISHLKRAVQLDDQHVNALFELALAVAADQPQDAIKYFRGVVKLSPSHHQGWTNLGAMLARAGQADEAIDAFERALALDPDIVQARMSLGGLWASRGRFADAVVQFQQAANLQPKLHAAHAALGQAHLALNQPRAAAEALQAATELDPRDIGSLMRLAWLQATSWNAEVRDGRQSLATANRLRSVTNGRDPLVLDLQAAAHAELGQFEAAVSVAREALAATTGVQRRLRDKIRNRIGLYQKHRPFREAIPPSHVAPGP